MGCWIGIDYGPRRIGLALADTTLRIATPADTLNGSGSAAADADAVLRWAAKNACTAIVVGLPLNMDGSEGAQAVLSKEFAQELRQRGDLPVELWDERLTSFEADQRMAEAGVKKSRRKGLRDALAAQVILQSFLEARPAAGDAPVNTPPA